MVYGGLFVNHTKQPRSLSLSLSCVCGERGTEMVTELSACICVSISGRHVFSVCDWFSRGAADFLSGLVHLCRTVRRPSTHRCVFPHVSIFPPSALPCNPSTHADYRFHEWRPLVLQGTGILFLIRNWDHFSLGKSIIDLFEMKNLPFWSNCLHLRPKEKEKN